MKNRNKQKTNNSDNTLENLQKKIEKLESFIASITETNEQLVKKISELENENIQDDNIDNISIYSMELDNTSETNNDDNKIEYPEIQVTSKKKNKNNKKINNKGNNTEHINNITNETNNLNTNNNISNIPNINTVNININAANKPAQKPTPITSENRNQQTIKNANANNLIQKNINIPVPSNKKSRMPPIVAYNIDVKKVIEKLDSCIGKNNFTLKKINQNVTHIVTTEIDNFVKASDTVKIMGNNFFTYTPAENKHHMLILKGIDGSFDEEDIKSALQDLMVSQHVIKVSKFSTRHSRIKGRDSNFWLLQCSPGTDLSVLTNIKYILHQAVKIEKLVKNETIQCKRCQRYGHAAANCSMQFRCVKCSENHGPGECKKNDLETSPYCINCKSFGHPASYRQCPKYQELITRKEQLKKSQEENRLNKLQMYSRLRNPELSYSKVLAPQVSTIHNNIHNSVRDGNTQAATIPQKSLWDQTCGEMFGLGFSDTLRQFHKFVPAFKAMSDPIEKKIALFEFFANMTYN